MISFIRGKIVEITETAITVDQQDIGFLLFVVNCSSFVLGQSVELFIQLVWHQDQGPALFAFTTKDERMLFNLLISCSGLGPKIALAALASMSPSSIVRAIEMKDAKALSTIPGIGMKKAESIILQLKDKVDRLVKQGFAIDNAASFENLKNLGQVLSSLGYAQKEVSDAVQYTKVQLQDLPQAPFDEWLKKSFSYLAKKT